MNALSTLEELAEKSVELGFKHLTLTDFMNVSGHKDLERVCTDTGLKPIYGCELNVADDKSYKNYNYSNLIALAKTPEGYKNLLKLVSAGWTENFYYRARVDWKEIEQFREGLAFILPTFKSPLISWKESPELSGKEFERLEKICGELWIEVNALTHPSEFSDSVNWWRVVADNDLYDKALLGTDVRCHTDEHYDVLESLFCLRDRKTLSDENRYKLGPDHHFRSEECVKKLLEESYSTFDWKRVVDNTVKLATECRVELPTTDSVKFQCSGDKLALIRSMIEEGIVDRSLQHSANLDERYEYELKLIEEKGFIDYFLVIRDLIKHAKDSGIIVGPARGSAAGSLVCYLLHIVDINPLEYGLMFERFIDVNRTDMPDIDIDFQDDRRDEVKTYLVEKYGEDKVGTLMTTMTFKGKMCLQDLGRVGGVPRDKTSFIKDQIIERSGGDSRASFTIEDAINSNEKIRGMFEEFPVLKQAQVLEGRYRQFGQHAAGVVVSNEPLTDIIAFYQRAGQRIASVTGKEAEGYGLLKIDLLGLNTLTVLDKTLKLVEKTSGECLKLQDILLNDEEVYKAFPAKYTLSSIFQMDGSAVQQVFKDLAPKNFHELAAVNALGRPGPLHSGSTTKYILRKSGKEKIEYTHEYLRPILEESYGVTIYQEQVMRIMREIGEFSWADTNTIRKVMSKRVGVEFFNKFYEKFLAGAKDKMDKVTIDEIWNNTCTFGSWAFNKSHAYSYAIISYWTMYLKFHYYKEFVLANCQISTDESKLKGILCEFVRSGHKLVPPDINLSEESFSVCEEGLRLGFNQIANFGEKVSKLLAENSPYASMFDLKKRVKLSEKKLSVLKECGALNSLLNTGQASLFEESPRDSEAGMKCFCPIVMKIEPLTEQLKEIELSVVSTPLGDLSQTEEEKKAAIIFRINKKNIKDYFEDKESRGKKIDRKKVKRPDLNRLASLHIYDDTGRISAYINRFTFPRCFSDLMEDVEENDLYYAVGSVPQGGRIIFIEHLINLSRSSRLGEEQKLYAFEEQNRALFGEVS